MSDRNRFQGLLLLALLLLVVHGPSGHAQPALSRVVGASGAASASGDGITLRGSVGQALISTAKNATHVGFFGFWYPGGQQTVGVERMPFAAAGGLNIRDIHPNPAHDAATLTLDSDEAGNMTLRITDLLGRLFMQRALRLDAAGAHRIALSLRGLRPGMYFLAVGQDDRWVQRGFAVR